MHVILLKFNTVQGLSDADFGLGIVALTLRRCADGTKGENRRRLFVKLDYVTIEKRVGVAIVRFDRKANLKRL